MSFVVLVEAVLHNFRSIVSEHYDTHAVYLSIAIVSTHKTSIYVSLFNMTLFRVVKSPNSPHQGTVGRMIKKGKHGWVTLRFHGGFIQWYKAKNLQRLLTLDEGTDCCPIAVDNKTENVTSPLELPAARNDLPLGEPARKKLKLWGVVSAGPMSDDLVVAVVNHPWWGGLNWAICNSNFRQTIVNLAERSRRERAIDNARPESRFCVPSL